EVEREAGQLLLRRGRRARGLLRRLHRIRGRAPRGSGGLPPPYERPRTEQEQEHENHRNAPRRPPSAPSTALSAAIVTSISFSVVAQPIESRMAPVSKVPSI